MRFLFLGQLCAGRCLSASAAVEQVYVWVLAGEASPARSAEQGLEPRRGLVFGCLVGHVGRRLGDGYRCTAGTGVVTSAVAGRRRGKDAA